MKKKPKVIPKIADITVNGQPLRIEIDLLVSQIDAMLLSNMRQTEKDGLHNLLGVLRDICEGSIVSREDIFDFPLKNIKLYQCFDDDGEQTGILATTLGAKKIDNLAEKWRARFDKLVDAGKDPDLNAAGFADYIKERGHFADRVNVEDEVAVP